MANRLVVLFLPAACASNPKPQSFTIVRCNPASYKELLQKCPPSLPPALLHPKGRGRVLIGREHDHHIDEQDWRHETALEWEGTERCGTFADFLRQHTASFFKAPVTA